MQRRHSCLPVQLARLRFGEFPCIFRRMGTVLAASVWLFSLLQGFALASDLNEVLSRMDAAGKKLKSMEAVILQKKWTDILAEFDSGEKGRFLFLRDSGNVYLRKEISEPTRNSLVIGDGRVLFYQPAIKQAQEYKLGSHADKAEFLLLGFGSDQAALKAAYEIELLGEESVDGAPAFKLQLKPKSDQVAAFFTRIVIWVEKNRSVPVQQQMVEPTGDYLLISFSDIVLNPRIAKSRFELSLPGDVKVIRN